MKTILFRCCCVRDRGVFPVPVTRHRASAPAVTAAQGWALGAGSGSDTQRHAGGRCNIPTGTSFERSHSGTTPPGPSNTEDPNVKKKKKKERENTRTKRKG